MSDEGWIPHNGVDMPCEENLLVDVKFQCGALDVHGTPASYWLWGKDSHEGYDIAFWRPHKNADGQAGQSSSATPCCKEYDSDGLPLTLVCRTDCHNATQTLNKEGHAAGPACSAPDEALIEEIAKAENISFTAGDNPTVANICRWAIREYIRRSAGKEKG